MKIRKYIATVGLWCVGIMVLAQSPYISRVYEYKPAPGQFTNMLPTVVDNDPAAQAEAAIADNRQGMVCLGAWGGYIVFGFDHVVVNVKGEYDILIEGNAFYQSQNDSTKGSSEPGVVCVSQDRNGNGLPDDEWWEIEGSEHKNARTIRGYEMTYYRTPEGHVATPDSEKKFLTDTTYVAWKDNQGRSGYLPQNAYHKQDYYPTWIDEDSMTFRGTLLPENGVDEKGTGVNYVLTCYAYGYADANPNTSDRAKIKIDWAVDSAGNKVALDHIDFVKVYTGVYQICGTIGEVSTEIKGAQDLHPDAVLAEGWRNTETDKARARKVLKAGKIYIEREGKRYNLQGVVCK